MGCQPCSTNLKFFDIRRETLPSSKMSIDTPQRPETTTMGSENHKSKSEKKHKSSHGEKKRKRDHGEDGHKSKSKKHRTDKHSSQASNPEEKGAQSPFHIQTSSLYLPLAPISQKNPLEGLCAEHLSPLILTYYPPFNGVLLSYSNPRLSEKPFGNDGEHVLLNNIDEYAVSWTWVTADFLLFKPATGIELEGYVNLQNEGHLGIVCWNLFNASIERKRLPADWEWKDVSQMENEEDEEQGETYAEEGAGYYVDGEGNKIKGMVKFRIMEIESSHDKERGFLSIEGTMLSIEDEEELLESERSGVQTLKDTTGRRLGGARALGATSLGVAAEDAADMDGGAARHRRRYP